ncbi:FadR/GntR family transcriptional regulator [Pallidibacillus pasinlerensis]|uniref:FadR family transcriptional regulator n=1 Tax=Pallidibacillus pasinlerensis TaxID=2703818 RepID=A0ABX0ACR4_9BACI|nr:FadR/GntR family transcriptional regulator [Pallidibacillus pasinlerensis]NCU18862.1 FadR family transcriptional regulator [Pallidibacillus pasinlerensis]
MVYKRIRTKKIYEEVADSLINMIKQGLLKPGDKLDSVEKMAEKFGVGRSAVREALSGLRSMGLVEMKQGEGTYVAEFKPAKFKLPVSTAFLMKTKHIKELYEVRKILEAGTAEIAALKHEDFDLEEIEKALNKMETANAYGDEEVAASADADAEFHMAIAKASQNNLLINLMGSVSELINETIKDARQVLLCSENRSDKLLNEHKEIFEAIKKRDEVNARKAMYKHLEGVNLELIKFLD